MLKATTVRHLEAARINRKHKPSDFLKQLASHSTRGKDAAKLVRKQKKVRKTIATKLRTIRKENGHQLARTWHRATY